MDGLDPEPAIEIADLRAELAAGNRSIFSEPLGEALDVLRRGAEQAVLLINRRGAATFILCRDCGESLRCPDCDLPFVFHLHGGTLRCHHCGRTAPPAERCPTCNSPRIRYFGAGTQRVEAELRARWPALRVGRLDSDTVAARRGFESVYDDFAQGRIDVLVGTQLAAKGLDLPSVTLAAVIAADVTLNLPDYRAAERTFQLLTQVAGRAGRGDRPTGRRDDAHRGRIEMRARSLLHIRGRYPQKVEGLELLMTTPNGERAGQFSLTPQMAEDLVAKRVSLVSFFLDNVQF